MEREEKEALMEQEWKLWQGCEKCGLCDPVGRTRNNVVFGHGDVDAPVMIIGDAPGDADDATGLPFSPDDSSGGLFNEGLLPAMQVERDEVFITQVVACRPTQEDNPNRNRLPAADEVAACSARLHRIIEIVDPYVILLLGNTAVKALVKDRRSVNTLANDTNIPPLIAKSHGRNVLIERAAFATWHPTHLMLPKHESMNKGSPRHKSYLTWLKAFQLADWYNYIYNNVVPPDREDA